MTGTVQPPAFIRIRSHSLMRPLNAFFILVLVVAATKIVSEDAGQIYQFMQKSYAASEKADAAYRARLLRLNHHVRMTCAGY